jgi:DNA polymerase/3'-5' exonuclease PolX
MPSNNNQKAASLLKEIAELLDIQGAPFKPQAYRKAALALEKLETDIKKIKTEKGLPGLKAIAGVGESIAQKLNEYLKTKHIGLYEKLQKETAIRQVITHYFETRGVGLQELKKNAKKRDIVYSRFTKPAKQLLELAGTVEKAKEAINQVASWAKSRDLDYAIETVFKKWPELNTLKPKEIIKKPFYEGRAMRQKNGKWYVVPDDGGEWLEFADDESKIEWKATP